MMVTPISSTPAAINASTMALNTSSLGAATKRPRADCSKPISSVMNPTAAQAKMADNGNTICGDSTTRQVITSTDSVAMPMTTPRYSDWREMFASKALRFQSRIAVDPQFRQLQGN